MPYTPPSHRSPSASAPTSPDASRRPSLVSGGSRPVLPRSASYLTRHRRTPSAVGAPDGAASQPSPDATSDDLKSLVSSRSVRQSPPPVTSDRGMPQGAILSPPESASNSDDDDLPQMRGRQIENLKELKELHEAVSQLPRHRESSPTRPDAGDLLVLPSQSEGIHHSFSASALDDMAHAGRKISHTRSVTEPHILISKSADNSLTGSDDESEEPLKKPQMVRKKSGELVRPALRPASRRRPSSMPGTPTFSKAVHFDSHLEHVRHFLQVDRPLAVSAGSSPNENYDSDNEYPFPGDERRNTRNPPYEWEIIVTNFPVETPARKALPVRLERVWLSNDQKCLIGSVVVTNLAFQKYVTCRFTLDYWKTTSEVAGDYVTEVGRRDLPDQHDRFNFSIKLSDLANLESKTLYFCIRYNVNGQEFWDNNSGTNFQIDFKKKHLPMNGKNNFQGASSRPLNSLPRSNRRSPGPDGRPRSMPASSDEFGENQKINFDQSLHEYLGETGTSLRLKGVKSSTNLPSDNLSSRLSAPSGQAFANRYDFGASLTAAVQAAKDAMGNKPDGLYMKPHRKASVQIATANTGKPLAKDTGSPVPGSSPVKSAAPATASAPATSGVQSPGSGSISSASYEELVNKYCFFGSKQTSPQLKDGTLKGGRFDGNDEYYRGDSSNSSSNGSPQMRTVRHASHAQHHTLHPKDPNPYFQHSPTLSMAASPVASPLKNPVERISSPLAGQPRNPAPVSAPSPARSVSPASMVGSFPPFAAERTLIPRQLLGVKLPHRTDQPDAPSTTFGDGPTYNSRGYLSLLGYDTYQRANTYKGRTNNLLPVRQGHGAATHLRRLNLDE